MWVQVPAPTGTGEGLTPTSPQAWRPEPGATTEPHQHQAHPCLPPGDPTPGSISGLSPPSSWWGATCSLHLAPSAASAGKQGSRPALWPPLYRQHHRVGEMSSAGLGCLARGHQVPSSLWCPSTAQGSALGSLSANLPAPQPPAWNRGPSSRPLLHRLGRPRQRLSSKAHSSQVWS